MVLVSACASTRFFAARAQSPPGASGAADRALPHDSHDGLTVSADAYTNAKRAKEKFGKADPFPLGILPVEVFLRNDNASAIRINLDTIQLAVHSSRGSDQNVDWLSLQDLAMRVAYPRGAKNPESPRIPIGLSGDANKKIESVEEILRPFTLDADVVPPKATIHGFLFFDLSRDMSLAAKSSLYVPDVSVVPANTPLMFFEVPLAADAQP